MARYIVALVGLAIVIVVTLLQLLTDAWLTATPLHPDKMRGTQINASIAAVVLLVALFAAIVVMRRIILLRRQTRQP